MTNKHGVHFTSKSQTWNTPKTIFDPMNDVWKFTLDAAALPESALCSNFYSPDNSGLNKDWSTDIVWCNPPYDDLRTWTKKCSDEYKNGSTVIMLIPSRTDTKAFHDYIYPVAPAVCYIKGRIKFANPVLESEQPNMKVASAPFPSCFVLFDNDLTEEKLEVLKSFGTVCKRL